MTYLDAPLTDTDWLQSMWQALRRIEDRLAVLPVLPALAEMPAPIVHIPPPSPPDLGDIVTAVESLKPGPTAAEIAQAIADVIAPDRPDGSAELRQMVATLKDLEAVLRAVGRQQGAARAVFADRVQAEVTNMIAAVETGLAKDATLLRRYGDHVTKAGVVSTIGDNTLHTPASGKKIRLYWIGLSTSQDNTAENLIQVKLTDADGTVKYRWRMGNPGAFVGGRTIEGNVNEPLILNLATTDPVDWNVDLEEVT